MCVQYGTFRPPLSRHDHATVGHENRGINAFDNINNRIMEQHPPAVLEITNSRNRTIKDSVNYYFVSLVFVILLAISFCAGG